MKCFLWSKQYWAELYFLTADLRWCTLVVGGVRQMPNRPSGKLTLQLMESFSAITSPAAQLSWQNFSATGFKARMYPGKFGGHSGHMTLNTSAISSAGARGRIFYSLSESLWDYAFGLLLYFASVATNVCFIWSYNILFIACYKYQQYLTFLIEISYIKLIIVSTVMFYFCLISIMSILGLM